MSFKRVDDNSQSVHELRRRRVGDLLREDLAEDEVSRLSNGRLTCMVCHHRPIFDTLDMFYVHRKGKKHELNAGYKAKEKQELEDLIMKRKHEQFVQTGNTEIQQAPAERARGLGCGKPYDPRTKKQPKPYDRKQVLDVQVTETPTDSDSSAIDSTKKEQLPGNRKEFPAYKRKTKISLEKDVSPETEMKYAENRKHSDMLLNKSPALSVIFKAKHKQSGSLFGGKRMPDDDSVLKPDQITKFVGNKGLDLNANHYIQRRKRLKTDVSKMEVGLPNRHSIPETSLSVGKSTVDWEKFQKYKAVILSGTKKPTTSKHEKTKESDKHCDNIGQNESFNNGKRHQAGSASGSCNMTHSEFSAEDKLDKKAKAEKELQLRGAGWKRDWTGKWVRDEDAEFDSDEETPDFP